MSKLLTTTAIATALVAATPASISFADEGHRDVQHVLLLSIDGFHAVDLEICIAKRTCPNLAKLTEHGIIYTNASATKPSDSFPGLLAQVTGGTSKSTGVFYDDSYDRTLFAPAGNPPAPCTDGPGAETMLAENIDTNQHSIDGGVNASLTGLNSGVAIDPNKLPGQKVNGHCSPLWPHYFIRTNSIFGVIHKHHLRTAFTIRPVADARRRRATHCQFSYFSYCYFVHPCASLRNMDTRSFQICASARPDQRRISGICRCWFGPGASQDRGILRRSS
jgi:hypothetical protein